MNLILRFYLVFCLLSGTFLANGQSAHVPGGDQSYHIGERLEIKSGIQSDWYPSMKFWNRDEVARFALRMDSAQVSLTGFDRKDLYHLYKDNNEWVREFQKNTEDPLGKVTLSRKPFLKWFYVTPANFFELDKPDFMLRINPILHLQFGKETSEDGILFQNTRGVKMRGVIDRRFGFFAAIYENQARFPSYFTNYVETRKTLPGAGLFKDYESSLFNIEDGYDFLTAEGYVSAKLSKHVRMQLGHGRNKIGPGIRSMILSDHTAPYFYFKLNTQVWKFHYQNLFTELTALSAKQAGGDQLLQKKYLVSHHLSMRILENLEVGLFEHVVFNRDKQFELHYLNPVILFRTVEQIIGSPDNVLAGIDAKYNFLTRYQVYMQFVLDEFKFDELLINRDGWWANKYAFQLGAKAIDIGGISHLDAQVELNVVRPFTYSHKDSTASFSHYGQELAHPLGSNFREFILKVKYRPLYKLHLEGQINLASRGIDSIGTNLGSDILRSNDTRTRSYGHSIGQGIGNAMQVVSLKASYQFRHNLFFDAGMFLRTVTSDEPLLDDRVGTFYVGARLNFNDIARDY